MAQPSPGIHTNTEPNIYLLGIITDVHLAAESPLVSIKVAIGSLIPCIKYIPLDGAVTFRARVYEPPKSNRSTRIAQSERGVFPIATVEGAVN